MRLAAEIYNTSGLWIFGLLGSVITTLVIVYAYIAASRDYGIDASAAAASVIAFCAALLAILYWSIDDIARWLFEVRSWGGFFELIATLSIFAATYISPFVALAAVGWGIVAIVKRAARMDKI